MIKISEIFDRMEFNQVTKTSILVTSLNPLRSSDTFSYQPFWLSVFWSKEHPPSHFFCEKFSKLKIGYSLQFQEWQFLTLGFHSGHFISLKKLSGIKLKIDVTKKIFLETSKRMGSRNRVLIPQKASLKLFFKSIFEKFKKLIWKLIFVLNETKWSWHKVQNRAKLKFRSINITKFFIVK